MNSRLFLIPLVVGLCGAHVIAETNAATSAQRTEVPAATPASAKANPVMATLAKIQATRQVVYKKVGDLELHLDVFQPSGWKASDRRPCMVTIHGGGWVNGGPRSMYGVADHCSALGMVAVSVQYRLYKAGSDVSVFECVKDARSAVRYVRAHASELGIDQSKIVVSGSSAGGHLAAATALFPVDESGEDTTTSCAPNALILFSPVIDTSKEGYGNAKIGVRWEELSPAHRVQSGVPPTIVFHGTADTVTPLLGAQRFRDAMARAGNQCELVTVEGAGHTYMFKDLTLNRDMFAKLDGFLASLGWIPRTPVR